MDEDDVRFIREMLYEAAVWRPKDPRPAVDVVFSNPAITRYIEGWGRPGNYGVIAESKNGAPLGAAWYRLFTQDEHGYGFISPGLPELTIGVSLSARGRGIGTMLLTALIGQARVAAWPALSLSVEDDNPAVRLYERLGFVPVGRVESAWTMRLDL